MSKDYDHRSSMYEEQEDEPQDRRGSCRYPVADVPAVLSWWESREESQEQSTSIIEAQIGSGAIQRPRLFDMETYTAIMARGPALRGAFQRPHATAARQVARSGQAGLPALAGGKAEAAPATKVQAALPALREKAESRAEAKAAGEPQMHSCQATILDISHTGISLISEAAPREGQSVWVRLDGLAPADWVEGSLAGVSRHDAAQYLVRIRFHQACPYDFFKAIVYRGKQK